MRITLAVILTLFLAFLLSQAWIFSGREKEAVREAVAVQSDLRRVKADLSVLQADFDFLQNPANLEKELRARFNYKLPGEKLIIIVPTASSTTSTP